MDKIIQKWSLEVVAVPQEESINLPAPANTGKTIPMKVKIRIKRGKDDNVLQHRVITVPKIEQANEYIEKVRTIYSDQTIMSFNMLTEPDHKSKTRHKSQNKFFHLFKTGKCLGTQVEDEDDPPYLIATAVKSQEVGSVSQKSCDEYQNKCNSKTLKEVTKQPVIFFGKCKRGGCLDPPFGEERYRYQPSIKLKQVPYLNNKENDQVSICENTLEKITKRSEVTIKISNHEEIDTFSTFTLYKARSEKSSLDEKYSDSIITYPPDTSSHELGVLEKNMTRRSSTVKNRLSCNVTDAYFMPPKTERSPEININRNKINVNSRKDELKNYCGSNDISNLKNKTSSLLQSDLNVKEITRNVKVEKPVSSLQIETEDLYETDANVCEKITYYPPNDSQIYPRVNQSIVDMKPQKTTLETEKLNKFDKYEDSSDGVISKTVKVLSQISNGRSPITLESDVFHELYKTDANSKSHTITQNRGKEPSKQINIEKEIYDDFSQEYFKSRTPSKDLVDNFVSEVTELLHAKIETPHTKQTTSNTCNLSHTNLKENNSGNNMTLPDTIKHGMIELKSIGSVEIQKDFISGNYVAERKFKCDNYSKSQVVEKISSAFKSHANLSEPEYIHNIKSNIAVHVTKCSSTQSSLREVTVGEQTNKHENNVTKNLELLDNTGSENNRNDYDKYVPEIKDERNSLVTLENLRSDLTINGTLEKNKTSPFFKIPSDNYIHEIVSQNLHQVGEPQLDEDMDESIYHEALLAENSKHEKNNIDEDYENCSNIQETDEKSHNTNMLHKLEGSHRKTVSQIGKSQLEEELGESIYHELSDKISNHEKKINDEDSGESIYDKLSDETFKHEKKNDKDYEKIPNIQEPHEISNNMLYKLEDYHCEIVSQIDKSLLDEDLGESIYHDLSDNNSNHEKKNNNEDLSESIYREISDENFKHEKKNDKAYGKVPNIQKTDENSNNMLYKLEGYHREIVSQIGKSQLNEDISEGYKKVPIIQETSEISHNVLYEPERYHHEIESQVSKSQLNDDLGKSIYHELLHEISKHEKNNNDEDYEKVPNIQEIDEISNNILCELEGDHETDIHSTANIDESNTVTFGQAEKTDQTIIQRNASSLSTITADNFLDNERLETRPLIKSQRIALNEDTKTYSTEIENIKIDNYLTREESITKNIEVERFFQNDVTSQKIFNNIVPYNANETLPNTLATKHSISTTSERKNVSNMVQKNETETNLPNKGKNTFSKDYTNAVIDKMIENSNISEVPNLSDNDISLKDQSFAEPIKNTPSKINSAKQYSTDKYLNGSYDILKQDFMPSMYVRKDEKILFEERKTNLTQDLLENDKNKPMIVDLAFQTYVNENNEIILRTFDISKEPQRFPDDSISVIKSALDLNNNKLSFAINSQTKLSIEISRHKDISTNAEQRTPEIKENIAGDRLYKENKKHVQLSDKEILQRSLAAIYENELIPVEKLIRNLIVEIDKIAKYRSVIENKLMSAKKTKSNKPTYCNKRCGCLRKS